MEYRICGRTGIEVSEVGLGCEHLEGMAYQPIQSVIDTALDQGINLLDVFMSEPEVRSNIGKALHGKREKAVIQGHLCSVWMHGQYGRNREMKNVQFFFEDLLRRLQTDYIDFGMLHLVDTDADLKKVLEGDIMEYAQKLKQNGTIRAIGLSSHNPVIAQKAVESGLIDVLLFSLNPAYDILPEDMPLSGLFTRESYRQQGLNGTNPVRASLYQSCEAMGTGITVMKGFGAGTLLDGRTSPFGKALTPIQCIHYALTRPAVASITVGCRTPDEVLAACAYESASEAQRDYSEVLSTIPSYSLKGHCMYCNHCLPCPSHLDIAQINKYLDLAALQETVPETVLTHYNDLSGHASDCIACGSCEKNCPFSVPVIERMERAVQVFGK